MIVTVRRSSIIPQLRLVSSIWYSLTRTRLKTSGVSFPRPLFTCFGLVKCETLFLLHFSLFYFYFAFSYILKDGSEEISSGVPSKLSTRGRVSGRYLVPKFQVSKFFFLFKNQIFHSPHPPIKLALIVFSCNLKLWTNKFDCLNMTDSSSFLFSI